MSSCGGRCRSSKGRMREVRTSIGADDGDWELSSRPRLSIEPLTLHAVARMRPPATKPAGAALAEARPGRSRERRSMPPTRSIGLAAQARARLRPPVSHCHRRRDARLRRGDRRISTLGHRRAARPYICSIRRCSTARCKACSALIADRARRDSTASAFCRGALGGCGFWRRSGARRAPRPLARDPDRRALGLRRHRPLRRVPGDLVAELCGLLVPAGRADAGARRPRSARCASIWCRRRSTSADASRCLRARSLRHSPQLAAEREAEPHGASRRCCSTR